MNIRKRMDRHFSDEAQVKFRDVAAFFTEEEWTLLHKWQKEFYKNVMKEIHQALISLGYQIVNPDNLLKIYKGKESCIQDSQDPERADAIDPRVCAFKTDKVLRLLCYVNSHQPEKGPKTLHPAVNPDILFRITQEESYSSDPHISEEIGIRNSTAGFEFLRSEVCLKNEVRTTACSMGHSVSGGIANSSSNSRHTASPDVVVYIEDEEETGSVDHSDVEIIDSSSSTAGDEIIKTQRHAEESVQFTDANSHSKGPSVKNNAKVLQHFHQAANTKHQQLSGNYWKLRGESDFSKLEHFRVHQRRPKMGISQKFNEVNNNLRKYHSATGLSSVHQSQTLYTCIVCNQSYRLKRELIRHMEEHSRSRIYECTECEKKFFRKTNLMTHSRTHTGEKPYACHVCHKRFSRKDNLNGHIRIHTGERPYKCTECGRSFTWKGDLNQHRRRHT